MVNITKNSNLIVEPYCNRQLYHCLLWASSQFFFSVADPAHSVWCRCALDRGCPLYALQKSLTCWGKISFDALKALKATISSKSHWTPKYIGNPLFCYFIQPMLILSHEGITWEKAVPEHWLWNSFRQGVAEFHLPPIFRQVWAKL